MFDIMKVFMKEIDIVGAIIIRGKTVLAVRRAEKLMRGRVDIPAGKIEADEPHDIALAREVWEETGYRIEVQGFLTTVDVDLGGIIYHSHLYRAEIVGGTSTPQSEEVEEVLWATPQQLLESATEHGLPKEKTEPLVREIERIIG